jgi:2-polyprenyl-3-methyl-5-hydroxy-6-metoxy-1,4-benzoquinol methylase
MNEKQTKWDEGFKAGRDYNPMNEIILDLILNEVENDKKNAIDLGCGTGDAVIKLAKRGMTVRGTDWSPEALHKAQERAETEGVAEKISLQEVDLNMLAEADLEKGQVDVILCKLVIAFVTDKKAFCDEVKTLLNKDGVFVIQTPVLHESVEYTPEDKPGIAVNYIEFKNMLQEVFSNVSVFNHSYYSERGDLVTFLVK